MSKYRCEIGNGRAVWWLLAAVASWLAGCAGTDSGRLARPGALSAVETDQAQDDREELTLRQRRQLEIFQSHLLSPPTAEIEPATRRGAAEELIAMQLAPATAILRQALSSGRGPVVVAVIEAMEASPITVVYEDLVSQFEGTMRPVLDALGLEGVPAPSSVRSTRKQADALPEEWVQRYRAEKLRGWTHVGW